LVRGTRRRRRLPRLHARRQGGHSRFLEGRRPGEPAHRLLRRDPQPQHQCRGAHLLSPSLRSCQLGTAPDELFAGLKSFNQAIDSHHDVLEKTPTTLDGKSALKVVLKKKPSSRPKSDFGNDPFLAKIEVEQAAREKQEQAKRQVFYITNTRSRIIIIQVDTPGEPEPAVLKTITDSFAFL